MHLETPIPSTRRTLSPLTLDSNMSQLAGTVAEHEKGAFLHQLREETQFDGAFHLLHPSSTQTVQQPIHFPPLLNLNVIHNHGVAVPK